MTLTRALLPSQPLLTQALLVLAGTALIALAARISVGWPVPMTLQTLAILVVGFSYGARLGAVTLATYLAQGALGLPVFAGGNGGLAYMMGATGGFLVGFLLMAVVAGWAADRGLARAFPGALLAGLAASLLIYLPGLAWPAAVMGTTADALWQHWMAPFLVGDAVKAALAALVVTGGWAVLGRR